MPDMTSTLLNEAKLRASLVQHEGLRLFPYVDTTGNLSIGYGRNLKATGISNAEADYLLSNDIQSAIREAQAQDWWPYVSDNDAWSRGMVELVFEMGAHGVASFHDLIGCLKNRDGIGAANALLNSRYATQVGQRAKDIAALFEEK